MYINLIFNHIDSKSKFFFWIKKLFRNRVINWYKLLFKMVQHLFSTIINKKIIFSFFSAINSLLKEFGIYVKKDFYKTIFKKKTKTVEKNINNSEKLLENYKVFTNHIYNFFPMNQFIEEKISIKEFSIPNFILCLDFETLALSQFYSNKYRVPIIYDHNLILTNHSSETLRAIKRYEQFLLSSSNKIINSNPNQELKKDRFNFTTIYTGESTDFSFTNDIRFYAKLPKNSTVIICTNSLNNKKELSNLIYSLLFNEEKYFLIFTNSGKYEKELKILVEKLKLDKRIKFIGWLKNNQLLSSIKSADFTISIDENQKTSVPNDNFYDFINFKIPIICSQNSLLNEIVIKEKFGISINFTTPEIVGKLISNFISDNNKIKKTKSYITKNGKKYLTTSNKLQIKIIINQLLNGNS
jgi:glycosyltransferase involved in cell wall biosynthesis